MTADRIVLDLPGGPIALEGTPALADLMEELRGLWAASAVDPRLVREVPAGGLEVPAERVIVLGAMGEPGAPAGARCVETGPGAAYAVSGLVTREVIAALVGRRLLLHAAAVDLPDLGCVLLVGASGAGKSTAARTLARTGRYLTDELAVIDPASFAIEAYPKPISLVRGPEAAADGADGAGRRWKADVAPTDLGLTVGERAERPAAVVLLDRVEASEAAAMKDRSTSCETAGDLMAVGPDARADVRSLGSVRRLRLAEALPRLVSQSSSVWTVPSPLSRLAVLLESVGGALELRYTEAADVQALLADAPPPLDEPWEAVAPRAVGEAATGTPVAGAGRADSEDGADGTRWEAAPFVEALLVEQGLLVLREGELLSISGGPALLWLDLATSGPATALTLAFRLEFVGARPTPSDIEGWAELLEQQGVVVRSAAILRGNAWVWASGTR